MTMVSLNRKTFQDTSNLALFQLISTDFWLPEELKFSLLSLPFLSLGCGPTVWVPSWFFRTQYFTYWSKWGRHSASWMHNLEGRDAVCQYTVGIFNSGLTEQILGSGWRNWRTFSKDILKIAWERRSIPFLSTPKVEKLRKNVKFDRG